MAIALGNLLHMIGLRRICQRFRLNQAEHKPLRHVSDAEVLYWQPVGVHRPEPGGASREIVIVLRRESPVELSDY